jgi:hypothetical protein
VTQYPWEQPVADYRLAVIQCLYGPIKWCRQENDRATLKWVWEPQLQKAMAPFTDL